MSREAFGSVALVTTAVLAIADLHAELVAGTAAWAAAWWLLREPRARG